MAETILLLPAADEFVAGLYALEEPLLMQLRPDPDAEEGDEWTPLPDDLDEEELYEAYGRVTDALPTGMWEVARGREHYLSGAPRLWGPDGQELTQLVQVPVAAEDLALLARLREELAHVEEGRGREDLVAVLENIAEDRYLEGGFGGVTDARTAAAWARRALAPFLRTEFEGLGSLHELVRASAGQERVELTGEQYRVYRGYLRQLIAETADTHTSANLTAYVSGVL